MRSALIRNLGTALTVLALPVMAAAQTTGAERIDEVRREASGHLGPLYFTPQLLLKELGVDSNVFNAAGEPKSDFTFTVGPTADVWLPVARRALFQARVGTDLVYYATYATERSIDPQFLGRGEVYIRRITLFAEGEYLNTRQRLNYEVDVRARHLETNATAGAAVRLTPKFSVELAGHIDETRFDADEELGGVRLQRTLDHKTTGYSVAARHRVTPLTTLVVRYEGIEDEFPFSPLRDSRSVRVMPGVEFKPRALIKGSAYVGYRRFTPSVAGVLPEFSGLVAQLGLSYTLLGSTTFGVSYARDLTYSYDEGRPFFINNWVGASVRRALGRRFDVQVSADRHLYAYQDLLVQPIVDLALAPRTDTTWNYAGGIGYRLGKGRVGFGVSYWERESTTRTLSNYDNLRFGTTVTYGF
jgi:Putative beta-barrel porin 2